MTGTYEIQKELSDFDKERLAAWVSEKEVGKD